MLQERAPPRITVLRGRFRGIRFRYNTAMSRILVTYWSNTEPPWDTDVPWIVRFAVRWAITMVGFLAAAWIVRGVDMGGWESLLPAAAPDLPYLSPSAPHPGAVHLRRERPRPRLHGLGVRLVGDRLQRGRLHRRLPGGAGDFGCLLLPVARAPAEPVPAPPGVAAAVREPGTGAFRRACFEFRGEGLGGDPVHVVAAAAAVLHLDADLIPGTGLLHAGAVYLHAVHQLLKVGGVALDADRVADPKLGRQVYSRHAYLGEIVHHAADLFLIFGHDACLLRLRTNSA